MTETLLYIHIAGGVIGFTSGFFAAIARKGSPTHLKAGKVFAFSMLIAALSSFALSIIRPNPFLFGIGLFTLYLVLSGWLWAVKSRQREKEKRAILVGIGGILAAGYMFYVGIFGGPGYNVVLLVFASIMGVMASIDVFKRPKKSNNISLHGGRMGGAFIAAVTAFVVTNFNGDLHSLILWLGPTLIGTPLIVLSIRKYYAPRTNRGI